MAERKEVVFDPAIAAILDPHPSSPSRGGVKRQSTPHEKGRTGRKVTITLPDEEWKVAVEGLAEEWGLRTCDVWVYAMSFLMAAVVAGEVERPEGEIAFWMRAGQGLELPWWPE